MLPESQGPPAWAQTQSPPYLTSRTPSLGTGPISTLLASRHGPCFCLPGQTGCGRGQGRAWHPEGFGETQAYLGPSGNMSSNFIFRKLDLNTDFQHCVFLRSYPKFPSGLHKTRTLERSQQEDAGMPQAPAPAAFLSRSGSDLGTLCSWACVSCFPAWRCCRSLTASSEPQAGKQRRATRVPSL